jgi:hypothetical protein
MNEQQQHVQAESEGMKIAESGGYHNSDRRVRENENQKVHRIPNRLSR